MSALDQVGSISRRSLHEELTDRLRSMIVEGVLTAGEKVPERELCEKLGVSRTPMREALKVLASDGLLTLEPNRGARVRAITVEELEEVFPLMGAFEALAGELACAHISDAQIRELKNEHEQMLGRYHASDMPGYFKHNQRIHELIMEAAGNRTLINLYSSLAVRVRQARYLANMSAERWQQAVDEHERIIQALEERDGEGLAAILKKHLENKFAAVRQWIEDQV
ncbi:GntR family transcriptional regulator [Granulosicoccus sp. 3-233]|uniref:GntR family transcriptional regulator n=1 Tax=Granulosicoccus sp. 3-233 TaxID=3417969 RepID=UPI003D3537D6